MPLKLASRIFTSYRMPLHCLVKKICCTDQKIATTSIVLIHRVSFVTVLQRQLDRYPNYYHRWKEDIYRITIAYIECNTICGIIVQEWSQYFKIETITLDIKPIK